MVLGIYGCGGQGRETFDLAKDIQDSASRWDRIVFIDDSGKYDTVNGAKTVSFNQFQIEYRKEQVEIVIAVGEPEIRRILREKCGNAGFKLGVLVHPSAKIGTDTILSPGVIVCYGSFISCNVKLRDNVLVQPNANIFHDSIVGSDSVISAFVSVAGACRVGSQTYIGLNASIREKTVIGSQTIVGMGSVVVRDIPDGVIALGNPARVIKNNEDRRVFR